MGSEELTGESEGVSGDGASRGCTRCCQRVEGGRESDAGRVGVAGGGPAPRPSMCADLRRAGQHTRLPTREFTHIGLLPSHHPGHQALSAPLSKLGN